MSDEIPGSEHEKLVTTDFSKGRFIPHGVMKIDREDNVLSCDITGPFNVEFMTCYFQMCAHVFAQWPAERKVFAFTRWWRTTLGSPDAIEYFSHWTKKYAKAIHSFHVWYMPPDIEGRSIMAPIWSKPFKEADIFLEVFDDENVAFARVMELKQIHDK